MMFNKEIKNIKKKTPEILELKNTMTKLKNSTQRCNRFDKAAKRVSKIEDKSFERIQSGEKK